MAGLLDFASSVTNSGAQLFIPTKGKRQIKSNIIGLAVVEKNLLPPMNSATQVTPPGGTATSFTSANALVVLAAFAFAGRAWVFGNKTISGSRDAYKADEEDVVFGSQRTKADAPEGELMYKINFKWSYYNTDFLNYLRTNPEVDLYFFTNGSCEPVLYDQCEPVFKGANNGKIDGDNSKVITNGGFNVVCGSEGDIVPIFGSYEAGLAMASFQFTLPAPTVTGTGLVSTLSGTVITKTSSGSGTIASAITQTVPAGTVTYSLFTASGVALPTGLTIDSVSGVVTVGAGVPAGSYDLVQMVVNKTGVLGELKYKLVAA